MGKFKPCMDILSPAQKRLWPDLKNAPDLGFTLYGDTAIVLRLEHRKSVDFDFFSEKPLARNAIQAAFPFMEQSTTRQDQDNTWGVLVPCGNSEQEHVKVSFFGAITFGRVGEPDFTGDYVLQVAAFDDLMATKVKTILHRAEAKDYRDVSPMIKASVSLSRGFASARQLYGPNFQPNESLKALVYFNDGDLNTPPPPRKKPSSKAFRSMGAHPRMLQTRCAPWLKGLPLNFKRNTPRRETRRGASHEGSFARSERQLLTYDFFRFLRRPQNVGVVDNIKLCWHND